MSEKIKLETGKVLIYSAPSFSKAKKVYQILSRKMVGINIDVKTELDANFYKDIVCTLLGSEEFEEAVIGCLEKCLYDGLKFDEDTFEDEKAREDYLEILFIVSKKSVEPFMKTLMQKYSEIFQEIFSASQT